MSRVHVYFGIIDESSEGVLYWSDTVELGDQAVEHELTADYQSYVTDLALDSAAALVNSLEGFDARARDALIAQLGERASVTSSYIDRNVDELGETLLDLLVHNSSDISIDVLRSLQLVRVGLFPEQADEEESFAVFEYSISPDDTDSLLIVRFDIRGDVVAVDMGE